MPKKVVEAYDEDGEVFVSYQIVINHMNMPLTDSHFIEEAMECHQQDGLSPSLVDKWVVRDLRPDE